MNKRNWKTHENKFIIKSNIISRAVRSPDAGIMTMRLFAFGLAKLSDKQYQIKKDLIEFNISLADFVKYYNLSLNQLYEKFEYKNKRRTLIEKEAHIIMNFTLETRYFDEENDFDFEHLTKKVSHRKNTGKLFFEIYKEIFDKHFVNQIKNFTKFYLPYTKFITTKYTWPLYEFLRSYLYVSSKTSKLVVFEHEPMDFKNIAEILNININSSYFKDLRHFKNKILESVKKDFKDMDIIMDYEIIKTARKNTHIKFYTKLNMEKFAQQQTEVYGQTSNNYLDFKNNQSKRILTNIDKDSQVVFNKE